MKSETLTLENEKEEAKSHFREMYEILGNLTREEIEELLAYEFNRSPETINEQVRTYFLKMKSERPKRAEQMMGELEGILNTGINKEEDVKKLCFGLYKYLSGFVIYHEGEAYTVHDSEFGRASKVC